MIQILDVVKCAHCGKKRPPKDMKIGTVCTLIRKWIEKKQRYQNFAAKQKNWYCRDGCHPDDRYDDDDLKGGGS
ncbi:MAG TPA: hypothetical protein DEF42_10455 [Desulfosporosinus sp.]|nr:hypothetical protein [Desulfosporosinus sp.]